MSFRSLIFATRRTIFSVSEASKKHISRPKAWLDIQIGNQQPKRVSFELFAEKLPYTIEELSKILTSADKAALAGKTISVQNTEFARIIPSLYALTGEFPRQESISGRDWKLRDENFEFSHDQEGLISLVNNNPDSKTSQLMITLGPVPWFDKKYVVFGKLFEGADILNDLEYCGSLDGKVTKKVVICDCGTIAPPADTHDSHHHHHDAHHH